jgi:hypothetical protein
VRLTKVAIGAQQAWRVRLMCFQCDGYPSCSFVDTLHSPLYIPGNMVSVSPLQSGPNMIASESSADPQNPLLAAANANRNPNDDDTLSDYVPESRDMSVSRAVSWSSSLNWLSIYVDFC